MSDQSVLEHEAVFKDIKIVDADTHVSEVHDLWTSRAPASLRARVPQVKMHDGIRQWVIDGDKPMGVKNAVSSIAKDGSKAIGLGFREWHIPEVFSGAYDIKARVAYMDQNGFHAQIAYPNVLGFGGQAAAKLDPELRLACTQIFNDAMAEMQADSGQRIFPMALIPWWDVKLAVAEIERCHGMGLRGVNTNTDPHTSGLPPLSEKYWDPMWEACSGLNLPVNFHIGASDESMSWFGAGNWPNHNENEWFAFSSAMLFMGNGRVLANIIVSRFLERWPNLKMVSVESGVGWIPFFLEALEYQMKECGVSYKVSPAEIFQRQMYACTWFEKRDLVASSRSLGIDNVLFETDFPHPTCLYPGPREYVASAAKDFTFDERKKVFGGNAARIYNLPV
jgi:predicted TIM-barrel fold metal-dependent hydrolase